MITEDAVESAALSWFKELGYSVLHGPDIAPDGTNPMRASYGDVIIQPHLEAAISRINPGLPYSVIEDVVHKVVRTDSPGLADNNRSFHKLLTEGVPIEYTDKDGRLLHDQAWLFDFHDPQNNHWVAVNQFTVIEEHHNRRPDIVVLVNGLPLAVLELKDAKNEKATIKTAFKQFQTYKSEIPILFRFNEALLVSDGIHARIGTLTAGWDRFMPWRTVHGTELASTGQSELKVLIQGVFDRSRFLDLIQNFIVFESNDGKLIKKMAAYHQFHAVNKALQSTIRASSKDGDRRVGVVWHTQGSGKSLTMAFYAGKVIKAPEMENPTLVVLTDRNDLDQQLFDDTFVPCKDLFRQIPVQADSREDLKERLRVASGGVIFTTIQKFLPDPGLTYPVLSERRNIVFIADEAHRSQYGLKAKIVTNKGKGTASVVYGFAKHVRDALPNASFIGFTATPVENTDKNTRAIFGNYIDTYDIHQAIEDKATVPIYYAARLVPIGLDQELREVLDDEFEEVTEAEEVEDKERWKTKWARLEAVVGAEKRIRDVAKDLVQHFEDRLSAMDGKAMVVCMSRRICVALYDEMVKLRPEWHSEDDKMGFLKVVMTGSASDNENWQGHIRNKKRRKDLADRFKVTSDPFKMVIVRDMWLTGFDVPCLHTMYVDKPMRGHGLMQAIARVNRVFKDKPGGLVVDYLGIGESLKRALAQYSGTDTKDAGVPQEEAVALMKEKYEIVLGLFHPFDYRKFFTVGPGDQLNVIKEASEHILAMDEGKKRYIQAVDSLSKAFALSMPHPDAKAVTEEVALFQAIRAALVKHTITTGPDPEEIESAIRQIVSKAITTDRVIDIFAQAGMDKPDISVLSDEFLAEVRGMPQKNLAMEALKKLLNDEIRSRERRNIVQARSFAEMLENAIRQYHNRAVDAAKVIEELIELARQMREAAQRGQKMGMTEEELAFYDALEINDSAVKVLGDETLRIIARELVETVRKNVTIDWTVKESVKANLRRMVRRILRRYGYPPDKQESATQTVLKQAEVLGFTMAA